MNKIQALTHGSSALVFAYVIVLIPMIVALVRRQAPVSKFLLSPVIAIAVTIGSAIVIALMSPMLRSLDVAHDGLLQLVIGAATSIGFGYATGFLLAAPSSASPKHRRGAIVAGPDTPARSAPPGATARGLLDPNTPITLAGIPVAPENETKHFKFIGTTGTGKSTAIREILSTALARGDRAVIADPDGGYLDCFYDAGRGDVILNPFEPDAVKWDLFGEIATDYDVDQLARSLIPDTDGADRSWTQYARTFFVAVIQRALEAGIRDDVEIFRLLTQASAQELKALLAKTSAGPFLEEGNERMFGSIRSVTSSAVSALGYTIRQQAAPFSVRKWVKAGASRHAGGRGGVLFIPYRAGEIAALRSVISAWMRIAIFEAMDRKEGDQRLWFVVDELDALGAIDGLKDALARLRKFGGRSVLGFQSISQVSGTYGSAAADTIVENCGNTLILRCSASEKGGTSQFASRLIGQREVVHTSLSKSRGPTDWMSSTTASEHLNIEPAVMASEIERLPDLEGFLKFASIPDWKRVRLTPVNYPMTVRPPRPDPPPRTPEPIVVSPPTTASQSPKRKRKPRTASAPAVANSDSRSAE